MVIYRACALYCWLVHDQNLDSVYLTTWFSDYVHPDFAILWIWRRSTLQINHVAFSLESKNGEWDRMDTQLHYTDNKKEHQLQMSKNIPYGSLHVRTRHYYDYHHLWITKVNSVYAVLMWPLFDCGWLYGQHHASRRLIVQYGGLL